MSRKISVSALSQMAVVAAIYTALTICLAPLSYGALQIRISEALMLLCCYRKRWCVSLTLGCMLANLFSGMAVDFLFGTLATLLAAILMQRIQKPLLAAWIPAVVNGILIGAELFFFMDVPFLPGAAGVAIGELLSVAAVGLPLLHCAKHSPIFCRLIGIPAASSSH